MVAVDSYVGSLEELLLCGAGLALCMVLVQAGTGWKQGEVVKKEDRSVIGSDISNGREAEEDEWEEGMEQGV